MYIQINPWYLIGFPIKADLIICKLIFGILLGFQLKLI